MKQTVKFGRIAGIPVGVHWSVLVITALLVEGLAVVVLPASVPGLPWAVAWLLVVDGGRLVGVLSADDVARAIELAQLRSPAGHPR